MAEYLIVIAVVGVAALGAWRLFGGTLESKTDEESARIASMTGSEGTATGSPVGAAPTTSALTATPPSGPGTDPSAPSDPSAPIDPTGVTTSLAAPTPVPAPAPTPPAPVVVDVSDEDDPGFWSSAWNRVTNLIQGDFAEDPDGWDIGGQVVVGLIPIAGQVADVRDLIANGKGVADGRPGAWTGVLAAGVGFIPGVGDALKPAIKGGRELLQASDEIAAVSRRVFNVGEEVRVPRSNGSVSNGRVVSNNSDGTVTVQWEENGQIFQKTLPADRLEPVAGALIRSTDQRWMEAITRDAQGRPVLDIQRSQGLIDDLVNESGGLQHLRRLNGRSGAEIVQGVDELADAARRTHGLEFRFVPDDYVPRDALGNPLPLSSGNPGRWDGGNTLYFRESLRNDPDHLLREVGHEYGAYQIGRRVGGKENLPWVIPGRYASTHMLDEALRQPLP